MANIRTSFHVHQGAVDAVTATESIGTDGCATCVGLIVIDNTNTKTCAHFDCAIQGGGNLLAIQAAADGILRRRFPIPANTVRVGYCTSSPDPSTGAIIAAIVARYGVLVTVNSTVNSGIVANIAGNFRLLGFNDTLTTIPGGNNHLAEI